MKPILVESLLFLLVGCASTPPPPPPVPGAPIEFQLAIWPTSEQHAFADDRGHIVVLDAWATWCGPCKTELPKLNTWAQQWKTQGVRVYAVNIDTDVQAVQPFLDATPVNLPILLDPGAKVLTQMLGLKDMPTTWVFDVNGHLVFTDQGSAAKTAGQVNAMLAASAKP